MAQTTIANYEKKLRFPDEQTLGRFADFFNVSLDYLMGRSRLEQDPGTLALVARAEEAPITEAARKYLDLLRANRPAEAEAFAQETVRTGASIADLYLHVIEPALKETGRLWELGELHVGEEHAISLATQRIMSRVFAPPPAPRGPDVPRCLLLAAPGEQHVIGATMICDLLRVDGWDVLFPGGNLGIRHVLQLVEEQGPRLVAISATMLEHGSAVADLVVAIRVRDSRRGLRILAGGQAFRSRAALWQEAGADATAPNAVSAVEAANRLIGRK